MSFINVAKSGVQNFSKYGKFIGEGKNNGVKVYESLNANGSRVLTSINKEGNAIKTVKCNDGEKFVKNMVDDSSTFYGKSVSRDSGNPKVIFGYKKIYGPSDPEGRRIEGMIRAYSAPGLESYNPCARNSQEVKDILKSSNAKSSVILYQDMLDGSSMSLEKDFAGAVARIKSDGDYKLTPELVMNKGESLYHMREDGSLWHATSNNTTDVNLAQMLFDSAKKIWQ